jgi:uncharacterized iron-regulated protein
MDPSRPNVLEWLGAPGVSPTADSSMMSHTPSMAPQASTSFTPSNFNAAQTSNIAQPTQLLSGLANANNILQGLSSGLSGMNPTQLQYLQQLAATNPQMRTALSLLQQQQQKLQQSNDALRAKQAAAGRNLINTQAQNLLQQQQTIQQTKATSSAQLLARPPSQSNGMAGSSSTMQTMNPSDIQGASMYCKYIIWDHF